MHCLYELDKCIASNPRLVNPRISVNLFLTFSVIFLPSMCIENMLLPLSSYKPINISSKVFYGSDAHVDHFHSIYMRGTYMLVGARNTIYNISLKSFQETNKIRWAPTPDDIEQCSKRQKNEEDCQNYIRIIAQREGGDLLACGTNAYRPLCRTYRVTSKSTKTAILDEESGVARSPFHVSHNSTSLFINDRLYTATVGDSNGRDALIYSKPLRTEQFDSQLLNEPQFVKSFANEDHAYFLFRETAVENINCGKAIFSRVGRVCLDDPGGVRVLRNSWTTFSKVRLNCSLPGEFPFHFDEIQSSSELGEGSVFSTILSQERTSLIYAVFSTPRNSMRGSAVCVFQMSDIKKSFEGVFKEQRTPQSNWLPVKDPPPSHPAASCPSRAHFFSDQTLNFIKSHPLMDRPVPSTPNRPIIVQTGFSYTISSIAVDWQVLAADHRHYDVLFLATDDGHVIKTYNCGRGKHVEMVTVEVLNIFHSQDRNTETHHAYHEEEDLENYHNKRNINSNTRNVNYQYDSDQNQGNQSNNFGNNINFNRSDNENHTKDSSNLSRSSIREMYIYERPKSRYKRLMITSAEEIRSIALQRCHSKETCSECVAMRDPYCSWLHHKCSPSNSGLQNLETGLHPLCKIMRNETLISQILAPSEFLLPTSASNCPVVEPCNCEVEEIMEKKEVITKEASQAAAVVAVGVGGSSSSSSHIHLDANDLPKTNSILGIECKECTNSFAGGHYIILFFIFFLLMAFGLGLGIGCYYATNNCSKKNGLIPEVSILSVPAKDNVYDRKPIIQNTFRTIIIAKDSDGDCCKNNNSQEFMTVQNNLPSMYESKVVGVK